MLDSEFTSTGSLSYGYDRHVADVGIWKYSHSAFVSFLLIQPPHQKLTDLQDWLVM
jgi:hypothetical protein